MTSRITLWLTSGLAALALVVAPGLVRAQQRAPIVHGGVDVEALTPRGLVRMDATVPASADVPVRLTFASQPGAPNELLVGVLVARDAAAARAALERFAAGIQRDVPRDASIGDVTLRIGTDLVAFARDNVFVWLRRLSGNHDVSTLARALDATILVAPAGATRAETPTLQVGARIAMSDHRLAIYSLLPVAREGGALALEVHPRHTGLNAYRTSHGWFVRVRDVAVTPTAADFAVRAVDSRLRVTEN